MSNAAQESTSTQSLKELIVDRLERSRTAPTEEGREEYYQSALQLLDDLEGHACNLLKHCYSLKERVKKADEIITNFKEITTNTPVTLVKLGNLVQGYRLSMFRGMGIMLATMVSSVVVAILSYQMTYPAVTVILCAVNAGIVPVYISATFTYLIKVLKAEASINLFKHNP